MERGSARRSSLKGRERAIVSQTNTETVSKATLGKLLRDGVERVWAFPNNNNETHEESIIIAESAVANYTFSK